MLLKAAMLAVDSSPLLRKALRVTSDSPPMIASVYVNHSNPGSSAIRL
jgi:hypothetical protein